MEDISPELGVCLALAAEFWALCEAPKRTAKQQRRLEVLMGHGVAASPIEIAWAAKRLAESRAEGVIVGRRVVQLEPALPVGVVDVPALRAEYAAGMAVEDLARKYRLTRTAVRRIVLGVGHVSSYKRKGAA